MFFGYWFWVLGVMKEAEDFEVWTAGTGVGAGHDFFYSSELPFRHPARFPSRPSALPAGAFLMLARSYFRPAVGPI